MNTRSFLPALLALLTAVLPLPAQTITTTTVDTGSGGDVGQFTSQAIVNGRPAIACYDVSSSDLMYVRALDANGTSWGTPVIVHLGVSSTVGQYASLAVVDGNPAISYYDASTTNLKYVRATDADGTAWSAPVTPDNNAGNVGQHTSLAVVDGNPAISYYDVTNGALKYVRASDVSGTAWGTPVTVDSAGANLAGLYTSLKVINGNPAISYYDDTVDDLNYVRATDASGTTWGMPLTLASTGIVGQYTSLAVINGNPAISYYNQTNGDLEYLRATNVDGTSWAAPVIAENGTPTGVGLYTSLVVVDGNPAISYYNGGVFDLKYVRATNVDGTAWGTPVTLDSTGRVGLHTSLLVVGGSPAISYYDETNGNLKYVRANDAAGTSWPAGVIAVADTLAPVVGQFTSQAIINGNPAISYYDAANRDLRYVRALDAAGTAWGSPVILSNSSLLSVIGQYSSLAVVNGRPAISYQDGGFGDLKYVRANDADGTTWGTPVTVDGATAVVGSHTSLAVVNGNPAISYLDGTNDDLKYVRASDADGTAWGTPVILDGATDEVGLYTSLEVINGNPAISYYDDTNDDLKYVRADDVNGTAWGAPVIVDSSSTVGFAGYTSLAVVNGNPAISYYDDTDDDLKYVRATDASGMAWGTPLILDSTGGVGLYTSLAVIDGRPAISYYDSTGGNLKFVRANDGSGTAWGTPVVVDSTGSVGQYTSLVTVNGQAAISYYDATNGDLKWARVLTQPQILVTQVAVLADGVGSLAFGTLAVGNSGAPLTFTITNMGAGDLTGLAVTSDGANAGDFLVGALSGTSVPVGPGSVTFTVTFTPSTFPTPARTAALHIASNMTGAENPFDIALTGTGLTATADTDGDGLNDVAELNLAALGFDWQTGGAAQQALVNTLMNNADSAGLYTPAQVQALHVGTPLLEKSGGTFKLTLRLKKATTLSPPNFQPFAFTEVGTVINGQGEIEYEFTVPENAAFFRIEAP